MIVTADHGNCEMMVDPVTGEPHTAHTLNPVPFILGLRRLQGGEAPLHRRPRRCRLRPRLQIMGLPQPAEMKGLGLLLR